MAGALLASILAGMAQAGGGIAGTIMTNNQNYDMWQQQNQLDLDRWKMQNEYNSPASQVERLKAAGLHPMFATGNPGNSSSIPNVTTFKKETPNWGAIGESAFQALASYTNIVSAAKNLDLINQQIAESKSREELNNANRQLANTRDNSLLLANAFATMRNDAFKNTDYFYNLAQKLIFGNVLTNLNISRSQRELDFFNQTFDSRVRSVALGNEVMESQRDLNKVNKGLAGARKDYVESQKKGLDAKILLDKALEPYVKEYYRLRNQKVKGDINNIIWSRKLKERTYHWFPAVTAAGIASKFIPW